MKPDPKGLPSVTTWKVLGRSGHVGGSGEAGATSPTSPMTWLALTPVTGRTHQLRVHCSAMGWPILGDNIYGTAPRFGGPVMHLHAREITVPLSKNKPPVRVVAPVPAHMRERLAACGWTGVGQSAEENNADLQAVAS